jgi:hypothetical protein
VESVLCQKGQRLRFNLQDFLAGEFGDGDVVTTEEIILGVILLREKDPDKQTVYSTLCSHLLLG